MFRRLLSLVLAAAALTAGAIHGQCIGPDNLNGPCCTQLGANLPNFPAITLPGLGICWSSCTPTTTCTNVTLGMPIQTSCGQFSVPMNVNDCAGVPLLTSKLHLDYTRTWMEFPVPGAQLQVWRFVVKADVFPSAALPPACPVPNCLGPHPSAFYYGYLDYAFDCAGGGWRSALVLFHGCDKFQHDPLFSDKPGVFHPTMSFALVAPSTTANPFVPALSPGPVGPVFAEALRNVPDPAVTLACIAEEVIVQGAVAFLGQACACPFAFVPPQVTARHITASTNCGSNLTSLNVFPTFPWFEDMTTSIGMWTTGASYPGPEVVWVDEGVYIHNDVCSSTGALVPYGEIKYGATTAQGFPAQSLTGQVLNKFTDLVNNFSFKVGAAILPPFVGSVKPSVHLAYLNYF
jgi:hypothetical protein